MKWGSAVSEDPSLRQAIAECAASVDSQLGGQPADLVVAFVSAHHSSEYDVVPGLLEARFGESVVIGCSGGGVIGAGLEVEHRPGFALTAASLPGVHLDSFHIEDQGLPDGDAAPDAWRSLVNGSGIEDPHFVILADPFSIRGEHLLMGLDYAFPASVKIGGLASGANGPGGNALYLAGETYRSGAAGIVLGGDVVVDSVVAQGCRPIGRPMQVTSCHRNALLGLEDRPALDVLKELVDELDEADRALSRHSLFLGVVMDEFNDQPLLGDFLIRNIVGVDPRQGALGIGEMLKEGQTVQFHLRDATTSGRDLDAMLTRYVGEGPVHREAGGLLFSCLGRGSYLYGHPDHDTDMFREKVGAMPLTGFFCNGEIGPVAGVSYLHGYTSSFGIFRPKD